METPTPPPDPGTARTGAGLSNMGFPASPPAVASPPGIDGAKLGGDCKVGKRMMRKLVSGFSAALSRQTLSTRYIPELDGLRCLAVLMVLFFHLNGYLMEKNDWATQLPWLTRILGHGYFGVEVFFVISGYIILLPFVPQRDVARKRPDLLVFYVRRMVRIWPPYAIAMTVFLLSLAVKKGGIEQYLPGYFASLGYVHNLLFGTPRIELEEGGADVEHTRAHAAPAGLGMVMKEPTTV